MKIPKEITIGKIKFKIKRIFNWLGFRRYGRFNPLKKDISIKRMLKKHPDWEKKVFFHELSHGIIDDMETNWPSISKFRSDEDFIMELGMHMKKIYEDLFEANQK